MRFIAGRNSLLRALGHITGIVERRNTIPILSNILIGAEASGVLTLKATDLDMEAIETIPAKVETPGAATVPAHTLHDIVRKLPDGAEIHIELQGPRGPVEGRGGPRELRAVHSAGGRVPGHGPGRAAAPLLRRRRRA